MDLTPLATALRVAADDALALAARTDHLTYLCGEDAGQCMRGMAEATRAHAEDLDRGAALVARCARLPGLVAMIEAMEAGAVFTPSDPVPVVRRHEGTARAVALVQSAGRALRRPFQRRAA